MSIAVLDSVYRDLDSDLTRLAQLLALVRELREFGSADPEGAGDLEFVTRAAALRNTIRGLSADLPVLSGTLLLYLAGRFEHFVRTLLQAHCETLAAKCSVFGHLPAKMQQSLRYFTAEVAMSPSKYGFDDVQASGFIVDLAANIAATGGLGRVNSQCVSITQSNLTPGVLGDLYKRVGIQTLWGDVGKQAPVKVFLEEDRDSDAEREAKARLEELMSLRNQIAHPTGSPSFPGPEQVEAFILFVRVLASTLVAVTGVHLTAFKPATVTPEAPAEDTAT